MGKPEFSADVVVSTQYGVIGVGSVYGLQTIDLVASEIKVGASSLVGRSNILIQASPDNTGKVYIGLDNTVTALKYAFALEGGSAVSLELDYTDVIPIYAIGSLAGQKVSVVEVKA